MYVRWKDKQSGKFVVVQFDAVMRETLETDIEITTHPVEEGSDITEHAHDKPEKLTVEGYVSNKPLPSNPGVLGFKGDQRFTPESSLSFSQVPLVTDKPAPLPELGEQGKSFAETAAGFTPGAATQYVVGVISNLLNPPPKNASVYLATEDFADRARAIYNKLRKAQQDRSRCEVGFKMVTLTDMLVAKISAPRTKGDSGGVNFTIDFQRVRIVTSATVDAPHPVEGRGQAEQTKGAQPPDDKKPPVKKKSVAKKVLNAVTGALNTPGSFSTR